MCPTNEHKPGAIASLIVIAFLFFLLAAIAKIVGYNNAILIGIAIVMQTQAELYRELR